MGDPEMTSSAKIRLITQYVITIYEERLSPQGRICLGGVLESIQGIILIKPRGPPRSCHCRCFNSTEGQRGTVVSTFN
jgi:hypothetical protein